MEPFAFTRPGRSWAALLAVLATWIGMFLLWWLLDAAGWIVAIVLLFTLPAVWDIYSGTKAGLRLDDQELQWFSGQHEVALALRDIEKIRLDTRLDFSVRASAVLRTGRKVRIPQEATPPHKEFEAVLTARGIKSERHHFSLIG